MFCPNCGSQIPDSSQVCPSCGADVTEASKLATQVADVAAAADTPVEPAAAEVPVEAAAVEEPVEEVAAEVAEVVPEAVEMAEEQAAEASEEVASAVEDASSAVDKAFAELKAEVEAEEAAQAGAAVSPAEVAAVEEEVAEVAAVAEEPSPAEPVEAAPVAEEVAPDEPVAEEIPAQDATVVVDQPTQLVDAPQETTVLDSADTPAAEISATEVPATPIPDATVKMPEPVPSPQPVQPVQPVVPQPTDGSAQVVDSTIPAASASVPQTETAPQQSAYTPTAQADYSYQAPVAAATPEPKKKRGGIGRVILGIIAALVAVAIATGGFSCHINIGGGDDDNGGGTSIERPSDNGGAVFDEDCIDSNDNITAYAILELSGEDLATLLETLDYSWSGGDECWLRDDDMAAYGASYDAVSEDMMTRNQLRRLEPGGDGEAVLFINSVGGYSSASRAFKGAMNCNVIDSIEFGEFVVAEIKDSSGGRYIVLVDEHYNTSDEPDGTFDIMILNSLAIKEGFLDDLFEDDLGSTPDEAWDTLSSWLEGADSIDLDSELSL